jgi:hypothetical protein
MACYNVQDLRGPSLGWQKVLKVKDLVQILEVLDEERTEAGRSGPSAVLGE